MSRDEPTRPPPRLGLSLSQLLGSALAAASAAFGASYLGVAGTIIGAAVASVIATVAGAMYSSSLRRTGEVVQQTVTQWSRTSASAPVVDPNAPAPRDLDDTRELVVAPQPAGTSYRRQLPWWRLPVTAAAVLAVTLGVLTGVEGVLGRPLASILGGSSATGTSLGSVGRSEASGATTEHTRNPTAPATTPSATPTPSPSPTSPPTSPPTGQPGELPGGTPTTPPASPAPSAAPTATPTPSSAGG